MIIANGYIRVKRTSGGGFTAAGYPKPVDFSLSEAIECQYRALSLNLAGFSGVSEPLIRQSYTILIEDNGESFKDESIVLYDAAQNVVGEFEVTRIQPLASVGQIKLYV